MAGEEGARFQALPDEMADIELEPAPPRWRVRYGLVAFAAAAACVFVLQAGPEAPTVETEPSIDEFPGKDIVFEPDEENDFYGEEEPSEFEEFPEEAYGPMHANATLATLLDFPTSIEEANDFMAAQPELAKELLQQAPLSRIEALFKNFLLTYGSTATDGTEVNSYDSEDEHEYRFGVFQKSLQEIINLNLDSKKSDPRMDRARYGITQLVDWDESDFDIISNGSFEEVSLPEPAEEAGPAEPTDLLVQQPACHMYYPDLGPSIDQGKCGNCWAHATDAVLRTGIWKRFKKDPGYLSTQYLVDCDPGNAYTKGVMKKCYTKGVTGPVGPTTPVGKTVRSKPTLNGVKGCCGGNKMEALSWIARAGGVPTKAAYGAEISTNKPTTAWKCKQNTRKLVTTDGPIPIKGEYMMSRYLCGTGGLSVGIWVDGKGVQHYMGGVIRTCPAPRGSTNHAVEVLGLDKTYSGGPIWIVRNSWGTKWGVNLKRPYSKGGGYFLLQYGKNMCNVAVSPVAAKNVRYTTR